MAVPSRAVLLGLAGLLCIWGSQALPSSSRKLLEQTAAEVDELGACGPVNATDVEPPANAVLEFELDVVFGTRNYSCTTSATSGAYIPEHGYSFATVAEPTGNWSGLVYYDTDGYAKFVLDDASGTRAGEVWLETTQPRPSLVTTSESDLPLARWAIAASTGVFLDLRLAYVTRTDTEGGKPNCKGSDDVFVPYSALYSFYSCDAAV